MKILICATESYPHGSGIAHVIHACVQRLRARGHTCMICSPTGPDIILGSDRQIKNFGIVGLIRYWDDVSSFFRADCPYDVVWLHNPMFIRTNPFQRYVVTFHSTYYGEWSNNVGGSPWLRIYKCLSSVVEHWCLNHRLQQKYVTVVGLALKEEVTRINKSFQDVAVIPNGVDIVTFHQVSNIATVRSSYGLPLNTRIILSIGRMTDVKQPDVLIRLFLGLADRVQGISLVIAGKGEMEPYISDLIRKSGSRRIFFLGYVPLTDIPDLYQCADLFMICSKYEGGSPPLVLSEALATGLPCIANKIASFSVVEDIGCGILIDCSNQEKSVRLMSEFINNANLQELGYHARRYVEEHLNWDTVVDQYITLFNTCGDNAEKNA